MSEDEAPNTLSEELRQAIRKEVVRKSATYSVAAVIVLFGIAGTGWLLYLRDRVPIWVNGVPRGAVAAFDLTDGCPDGWNPFDDASGRFIIGAGQGKGLKERLTRAVGGDEEHKLTIDELPSQQIQISGLASASRGDRYNAGGKNYPVVTVSSGAITVGGSGNPISIMPPFIALRYCKKV
ncbi:hypothetical protein U8C35_27165 (plasmid) [Sinorhizobium medicae]|uniref:hypothetical protein n=1 Tax=Sinorhizobium medicae TaxID=110321 RepID=UPI00299DFFD0|nr:hypothetical protein [Sinorhizobium medicae]MDX0559447.1 hypothetical protein [Sinorhizobium medicae]WQO62079.1 hypothetical protein U8C35_27165 [Sinorhizobium medicae]